MAGIADNPSQTLTILDRIINGMMIPIVVTTAQIGGGALNWASQSLGESIDNGLLRHKTKKQLENSVFIPAASEQEAARIKMLMKKNKIKDVETQEINGQYYIIAPRLRETDILLVLNRYRQESHTSQDDALHNPSVFLHGKPIDGLNNPTKCGINSVLPNELKNYAKFEVEGRTEGELLKERLEKDGVPEKSVKVVSIGGKIGRTYIMVAPEYEQTAENTLADYYTEQQNQRGYSRMDIDELSRETHGQMVECTVPEKQGNRMGMIMTERLEALKIPYATICRNEGECVIVVSKTNEQELRDIKDQTYIDLATSKGFYMQQQADWKNQYQNEMIKSALTGSLPNGKKLNGQYVFINEKCVIMVVTQNQTTVTDGDRTIVAMRSDEEGTKKVVSNFFENAEHPIMMNTSHLETFFSEYGKSSKREYISQQEKKDRIFTPNGRPNTTIEDFNIIKSAEEQEKYIKKQLTVDGYETHISAEVPVSELADELGLSEADYKDIGSMKSTNEPFDNIPDSEIDEIEKQVGKNIETFDAEKYYEDIHGVDNIENMDIDQQAVNPDMAKDPNISDSELFDDANVK